MCILPVVDPLRFELRVRKKAAKNNSLTLSALVDAAYFDNRPLKLFWLHDATWLFSSHTQLKNAHSKMTSFFVLGLWKWALAETLANLFPIYINIYVSAVNNICLSHPNIFTALWEIQFWWANLSRGFWSFLCCPRAALWAPGPGPSPLLLCKVLRSPQQTTLTTSSSVVRLPCSKKRKKKRSLAAEGFSPWRFPPSDGV